MLDHRTKRGVQVPLLKDAAWRLVQRGAEIKVVSGLMVIQIKLAGLHFWLTPFGPRMNLDVWDETRGGGKVLNVNWGAEDDIEIGSFQRGDWEDVLLKSAAAGLH